MDSPVFHYALNEMVLRNFHMFELLKPIDVMCW